MAKNASNDAIEIAANDRVFVLTGAGISAESGLRTFRDSNGLWAGHQVETVATPEGWEANPELVWQFYSQRRREAQASQSNSAHYALAELEERIGDRFFLCTQNVDDLHERAGFGLGWCRPELSCTQNDFKAEYPQAFVNALLFDQGDGGFF